jgi:transposase InsO family protein
LRDVAFVPGLAENLFAVRRATEKGAEVNFVDSGCTISREGEVLLTAEKTLDGLYVISRERPGQCHLGEGTVSPDVWHRRLGHVAYETLAVMADGGSVEGMATTARQFRERKTAFCEPCVLGMHQATQIPKVSGGAECTRVLELVHMDLCGPMPCASKGGSLYFATFLDDFSKLSVVVPIKRKDEVTATVRTVLLRLETQTGKKVRAIQTDRGGEYLNAKMSDLLWRQGVVHRKTAGYAPEQNGATERLNGVLEGRARALLQ